MTLELRDVTVRFGTTTALDDLSLSVRDGEVLALLGPSGCGKSTLLRAVAGLERPESGSITWDGEDLRAVPVHERDVGLMFQDHALFGHRTVAQNIGFGLRMRKQSATTIERRVGELLDMVDLAGFEDRHIDGLSGGEAQRVALARALAPDPRLLLLDEPLGALDRGRREQLVVDLRRVLRALGQTTLHVTHDQDEAFSIADRVAVMNDGRLQQVGTPAELWNRPINAFVAAFVGHTVAILDGRHVAILADAAIIDDAGEPMEVIDAVFRDGSWFTTVSSNLGDHFTLNLDDEMTVGTKVPIRLRSDRIVQLDTAD